MRTLIKNTLAVAFVAALALPAQADLVSVNFGSQAVTNAGGAGVVNDTSWENLNETAGVAGSLDNVDSSTIDVSWVAHSVWRTNANTGTGGGQLMKGRWDSHAQNGDLITVSNINATYANYDVIVYYAYNQGHSFDLAVGGGTAVHIENGGQNATAGAGQLGLNNYLTSGPSDGTNPSFWHRFTDLSADSVDFTVTNAGRAAFTGFQIVAVPEPSSILLFGLAGLGLVGVRRRKFSKRKV